MKVEAFVEPRMRPFPRREQIAEPLVPQLVRHQPVSVELRLGPRGMQHAVVVLRCRAHVLHAAEDEIRYDALRVLGPWIRNSGLAREYVDRIGSLPEPAL